MSCGLQGLRKIWPPHRSRRREEADGAARGRRTWWIARVCPQRAVGRAEARECAEDRRCGSSYVPQASSPASSGGVSPPVPTRGETPRELAGEDACGTLAQSYVPSRTSKSITVPRSASSPRRLRFGEQGNCGGLRPAKTASRSPCRRSPNTARAVQSPESPPTHRPSSTRPARAGSHPLPRSRAFAFPQP